MDASLQEVEWNQAVKSKGKPLSAAARHLREETRRALLGVYAPIMVLNDWWADDAGQVIAPKVHPLPDVHPVAAAGMVAWLNDRTHTTPADVMSRLRPHLASIAARAKQ